MIRRISISNYALIRELTLEPAKGFNIITGETGSGKSIILGALSLLQGKRADSKSISNTNDKSIIEAEVVLSDGRYSTLRREIMPSGRSKAFIDGVQVSLAELADVASPIIDIHSQHKNTELVDPEFQLETIDKIADNSSLLTDYHKVYAEYRAALHDFVKTREKIERAATDIDYLEFQLKEFEGVELIVGEDETLEKESERLAHIKDIYIALSNASRYLCDGDESATDKIQLALYSLRDASKISNQYLTVFERLEALHNTLEAIAQEIDNETQDLSRDPIDVDHINDKLNKINALKKKHRATTIAELIEKRNKIVEQLDLVHNSETTLRNLEQTARRLKKNALEIASQISSRRKEAAIFLEKELCDRARPLGMENIVCKINVLSGKLNPDGIDSIEFLFAFNKNQELMSAANRASGGELSRVMLALKSITIENQHTPTIIFDEIDTGVSGDVANRMGLLMEQIGKHIQVISITHLPQVAALGDRHFKVFKRDDEQSTRTYIAQLNHEQRRAELALMLSGDASDQAALATADSLFDRSTNN